MDMIQMHIDDFIAAYAPLLAVSMPQTAIDDLLRFGSNTTAARMKIVRIFSRSSSTDAAPLLRRIFHGGYGVRVSGAQWSAWYADDGIHVAQGAAARKSQQIISWQEAAEEIASMLRSGTFTTQSEIDAAPDYERKKLAEGLWYMTRDIAGGMQYMQSINAMSGGGFPEATARLAAALADAAQREAITQELRTFVDAYNAGHSVLRFRYHNPPMLLRQLESLAIDHEHFVSVTPVLTEPEAFITDDEIDAALSSGSSVSNGKLRIYRFFTGNAGGREAFLRQEYGIGGRSHAVSGADHSSEHHDGKGITLGKFGGGAQVTLAWREVAQRIQRMIDSGDYLNAEEMQEAAALDMPTLSLEQFAEQYA